MPLTLDDILFKPRTRSFLVGTTGTGKSTLSASLLNRYHQRFRSHYIYLVDPKSRFVAVEPDPEFPEMSELFPHGSRERRFGRRDAVAVTGDYLEKVGRHTWQEESTFVVQSDKVADELMQWLYDEGGSVLRPSLLYLDESFDMMKGSRANPNLRRLLQQGREIGVGVVIINQRPAWIDRTILTESDHMYVGTLDHEDDRKAIERVIPSAVQHHLGDALPLHTWLHINKRKPGQSRKFRHRMVE